MKRVILESPYAGDIETNLAYARRAVRHSLSLGEAPIASHLLYTQPGILDDKVAVERAWGIEAGLVWLEKASSSVFYLDRGFSTGMKYGMHAAQILGKDIYARWLDGPVDISILGDHERYLTGCGSYH